MKRFRSIAAAVIILLLGSQMYAYAIDSAYISNKSRDEATVSVETKSGTDKFTLASRSSNPSGLYQITREYTAFIIAVRISSNVRQDKTCRAELPEASFHLKGQIRCAFTTDYACDCETYTAP